MQVPYNVFGMNHVTRIWSLNLEDELLMSKLKWILSIIFIESPLEQVLRHSDNYSRTLQKPSTTASQGKETSDENFDLIWDKVLKDANAFQFIQAPLPRKGNCISNILLGKKTSAYDDVCDVNTSKDVSIVMSSTRWLTG